MEKGSERVRKKNEEVGEEEREEKGSFSRITGRRRGKWDGEGFSAADTKGRLRGRGRRGWRRERSKPPEKDTKEM